ncbi:MAG: DUF3871 family protein [Taibaiella sp.]|nr:DUF3871 family protein [Taibaiella sp.]
MENITVKEEIKTVGENLPAIIEEIEILSSDKAFIEANTISSSLTEVKNGHIIPVWVKDNEPVISHAEFIETTLGVTMDIFRGEGILKPNVRLSHPIKGRIPEAKLKPANQLLDHEKTIYFERMMFVIEIPTVYTDMDGNRLNLTVGGVKAYNLDNLYNKSGQDQHFKVFIGFKNMVCCNLCVITDGYQADLKVKNVDMLKNAVRLMLQDFDAVQIAGQLKELGNYELSEQQFANLLGRCRMYQHMPDNLKQDIPDMNFGDSQINAICKDYFSDNSFCSNPDGSINLWNLYNLFTGANKSSYIDTFLDRSVNAFQLVNVLRSALMRKESCWYLN